MPDGSVDRYEIFGEPVDDTNLKLLPRYDGAGRIHEVGVRIDVTLRPLDGEVLYLIDQIIPPSAAELTDRPHYD